MMAAESVYAVSKKVRIDGDVSATWAAMIAICRSSITLGPLGIVETSPSAAAPVEIASSACSTEAIQQIFTTGGGIKS
jgi:hypothetical protein